MPSYSSKRKRNILVLDYILQIIYTALITKLANCFSRAQRRLSIVTSFINKGFISCDSVRTCTRSTQEIKEQTKYTPFRTVCSASLYIIGQKTAKL